MKLSRLSCVLVLLWPCAFAQETPAEVTDEQVASYQSGLEADCRRVSLRNGESAERADGYCGCYINVLKSELTPLEWRQVYFHWVRHEVGDARAVVAPHTRNVAACQTALPDGSNGQAQAAALAWLALIDAGDYTGSWDTAAASFRDQTSQKKWVSGVKETRRPFGDEKARELVRGAFAPSVVHGPPKSEYVVVMFRTTFERQGPVTEVVIPIKDGDGRWRVSGYGFIPKYCLEPAPKTIACGASELFVGMRPVSAD